MPTSAEILTAVARGVKDPTFKRRSRATYLEILNEAQEEIVTDLECLIKVDSSTLTITADTQEFTTLPSDFIKFPLRLADENIGMFSIGTNANTPLKPTTTEQLDLVQIGWRGTQAATPEFYYIIEEGTLRLGIYPKASATFIAQKGSVSYLKYVYKPPDMANDSLLPFDNSARLEFLHKSLKYRAWQEIALIDHKYADADRWERKFARQMEKDMEKVDTLMSIPKAVGFDPRWRTTSHGILG